MKCFVLSFVTGEQQKKVPKKSALVLSVMIEAKQAGCAGPPWLCARLQPSAPSIRGRLLEAYGRWAGTPGALRCWRMKPFFSCENKRCIRALTLFYLLGVRREMYDKSIGNISILNDNTQSHRCKKNRFFGCWRFLRMTRRALTPF
jgi:hypothetical protein